MTDTPDKTSFYLPAVAVRHLIEALTQEVETYDEVYRTLDSTQDAPDDYDPNDRALYAGVIKRLEPHASTGLEWGDPLSKPVRFSMGLIPWYARKNLACIAPAELEVVFRAYAEYVASLSIACLEKELAHGNTSFVEWMKRAWLSLRHFPGRDDEAPRKP